MIWSKYLCNVRNITKIILYKIYITTYVPVSEKLFPFKDEIPVLLSRSLLMLQTQWILFCHSGYYFFTKNAIFMINFLKKLMKIFKHNTKEFARNYDF